ncbi:S9 family peptidase [Bacillus sp. FJAT-47783]|uniref:S9 family peptidase n=1 Tax=Bacillus sp. FJAT-47783 TaxID=2922712 RepID=UPI001FACA4CD|nr:S9 family peptidase [Bacillus sp. FJAT-47783]
MQFTEEELLAYLTVKSASKSEAIPTKNKFTFISNITGLPQVWTMNEEQEPVEYVHFEDRIMSVHHSPKGDKTVVGMDDNGNEKQQLFLFKQSSGEIEPLVQAPDCFHHFGGWSPNGKFITFSSNRRNPGFFDVYIQDITNKKTDVVYRFDGKCIPLRWLPDGENILIEIPETNIDQAIYILNIETGKTTRVGKSDMPARYQSIEITKDGKGGFMLTDLGEETLYLSRFSLDCPGHIERLVHFTEWDIEEMKLSPDENHLVYTLNEGGISSLYIFDLMTNKEKKIESLPDGVINSLSWLNPDQFIFSLNTPTSPGDIWEMSLSKKKVKRITFISQAEAVESLLKEPKICSFSSFDGLSVPYFYYEKESGVDKPAVIYVHGGPESQTRATYNPVIQYLVNQGIVVIVPNIRGSKGYGREYIKLDDARKRMDAVDDLAWLVKDIVKSHGVNPKKIGIMGRSYGGFMVLAALTHYPDLWAAGVNIVGFSNIRTFLENTGSWRRYLREYEYGSLKHDADFFEEIAPINHFHKIKAPLLVFHGRNDSRVPISEAEQLVSSMKSLGQDVQFTIFEDEGHQTEKIDNQVTMNTQIAEFLKKNLQKI